MEEPKYHLDGVVRSRQEALEDFDGPLDVILQLLSKNKIEIQDISISAILEQYLAYLDEMKKMDMEIASEFISMASYLMYIKSRMLLSVGEQEEAMSEMELLIRSLEERQRKEAYVEIRKAAEFLAGRNEIGCNLFTKQPEPIKVDGAYQYRHDASDLTVVMAALMERGEKAPLPVSRFSGIVGAEPYPVVTKAAEVLRRLIAKGVSRFRALFSGSRTRSEIVATFLAILELCRLKSVRVEPDGENDISVTYLRMPEEAVAAAGPEKGAS